MPPFLSAEAAEAVISSSFGKLRILSFWRGASLFKRYSWRKKMRALFFSGKREKGLCWPHTLGKKVFSNLFPAVVQIWSATRDKRNQDSLRVHYEVNEEHPVH